MADGQTAAFSALGPAVRDALAARGFDAPTEPQRLAIPPIAAGDHTLVIAPTGSGKTETAMLPILDALLEAPPDGFGALYVTPLRALNRDLLERLEWWGEALDLAVDVRHGDTTRYRRSKQAEDPPDVLITTPETLQAMLTGERLREGLADVSHVVVDEVHELAASKRGAQLAVGLERLRELAGPMQRVGLSATVGEPETVGAFLTGDRPCTVRRIDVGSSIEVTVREPSVTDEDERLAGQLLTDATTASHVRLVRDIVAAHESTLIFVNTRQTAEALGARCGALDLPIGVHHGSLSRDARIEVEDRFKAGDLDGLLCTSSMELGIDVGRVDHVVQYQSPRQVTRLLQRVGRAGHRHGDVSRGTIVTTRADDTLEAAVIARRARDGAVEPASIHEGSLDVVANQVAGAVYSGGSAPLEAVRAVVTRAHPFADLSEESFRSVVGELHRNRIVWHDESTGRLEPSGSTMQYVYANLSMIPDEETYDVQDIASGGSIGTLDERFVVNFAAPGAVFVQRGEMWRIAEVDDDEAVVKVSPIEDPAGEVPSWIGQEIPVPWPIAQEVGALRGTAADRLEESGDVAAVARGIADRYPVEPGSMERALEQLDRHVGAGHPMPTDECLLVEYGAGTVVCNAPFGHRANEALGRAVSALLGQRTGSSIGLEADPYRIELEVPGGIDETDVAALLAETDPDHLPTIVELALKRSDSLAFRLSQVSAKFGALKRWEGSGRFSAQRLLAALEDTPMYEEAVREVFHEDLDVEAASRALASIRQGELTVATVHERTPVGLGGRSSGKELLAPEDADASVVQTVRERIQSDRVILCCTHCRDWSVRTRVERVQDQPTCPACDSTRIAALNPWAEEVVAAVQADDRSEDQEDMLRRAVRNAGLVQSHGKRAVIALAGRGVGPQSAARIINRHREDEDDFYRDILAREREYARTKAFWD